MTTFSHPLDKSLLMYAKKIFLSYPGSWLRQAIHAFSHKIVFLVEVYCPFIDIHWCLGSILNVLVFHNKIYKQSLYMLLQQ